MHYNPVKHGYVACPHSSFRLFVAEKRYEKGWCCRCAGESATVVEFEDISRVMGE